VRALSPESALSTTESDTARGAASMTRVSR
jgi:hypothetical protein